MSAVCSDRQPTPSLCEILDRLLAKGAVLEGDLVLSVAGVDLVTVKLMLLIASTATIQPDPRRQPAACVAMGGER